MRRARLELRSLPVIALAYVAGPAAGLTTLWLGLAALDGVRGNFRLSDEFLMLQAVLIVGGLYCAAAELLVVTPILIGFQRYRWAWLNGWSAAAIGFATGTVLYGAVLVVPLLDSAAAHARWAGLAGTIALAGLVGVIAAVVFRLIAVRAVSLNPAP